LTTRIIQHRKQTVIPGIDVVGEWCGAGVIQPDRRPVRDLRSGAQSFGRWSEIIGYVIRASTAALFIAGSSRGRDMRLSQIAEAVDAESLMVPAGNYTALKPQSTNTFTCVNGTTVVISGTGWSDVATLEFPLFSGRLSILVS
jgi:hypothetical protein